MSQSNLKFILPGPGHTHGPPIPTCQLGVCLHHAELRKFLLAQILRRTQAANGTDQDAHSLQLREHPRNQGTTTSNGLKVHFTWQDMGSRDHTDHPVPVGVRRKASLSSPKTGTSSSTISFPTSPTASSEKITATSQGLLFSCAAVTSANAEGPASSATTLTAESTVDSCELCKAEANQFAFSFRTERRKIDSIVFQSSKDSGKITFSDDHMRHQKELPSNCNRELRPWNWFQKWKIHSPPKFGYE